MRPQPARGTVRMRLEGAIAAAVALAAAAMLSGCAGMAGLRAAPKADTPPPVDPAVTAAVLLATRLEDVQRLLGAAPAEQARILATAKQTYDSAPTAPSGELQYALVLAAPGQPGFDPAHAEQLLRNVLSSPLSLSPSERALAALLLEDVEQQLALAAENQRLQLAAASNDRERMAAASKRLQAETEENAHLRKELEETRAKLNAIANIERSLNRRKPSTQGPTQ
jgi:YfhG lipoprotein